MTPEAVELIAQKTVEHSIDRFSSAVADKIDTSIKLHEARNVQALDQAIGEAIENHVKNCPIGTTVRLTTSRVVIGIIIFMALSGGSAEITRKLIEFLAKII